MSCFWLPAQLVDATQALNLSAGLSNPKVLRGLNSQSPDTYADRLRAFHRGLKDTDYVENENVTIPCRWTENQLDRLPELGGQSGPPTGCGHRRRPFGVGGQGGYHDDPHSIHRRRPT
jgi:hypothetical protein